MLLLALQRIRNNIITYKRYSSRHDASPQLLSQEDIVCVYEYIYDIAACNGLIEINIFPI